MKIFITGTSSGIGRELTKLLINQNHEVWGVARRQQLLESLRKETNSGNFLYSICDLADEAAIKQTADEMRRRQFLPDVVILNAGIFPNDISAGYNHELAQETFKVNVDGALKWVDIWLPEFLQRRQGQFIAICSTAAFRGNLRGVSYPASKAALAMAFRGLRLRYAAANNIDFSTIYFGPLESKMWEGKKSSLTTSPLQAAMYIIKIIRTKKDQTYFPFLSTWLFRLTKWLPDRIYVQLTERLLK